MWRCALVARVLVASMAGVLTVGCGVPSLQPLYTDATVVLEPAVEGTWVDDEGTTYDVRRRSNHSYRVAVRGNDGDEPFSLLLDAHLVRVGDRLFVDLALAESEREALVKRYGLLVVPAHQFGRIRVEGDVLTFEQMSVQRFDEQIAGRADGPAHSRADDLVVLTDTPASLQAFLAAHGADDQLFPDAVQLRRSTPPPGR